MALSNKDMIGRGTSDLLPSLEDGCPHSQVELAKLGDMVKSLKDEYTRASSTLSELESLYSQCSGRLSDWHALIGRIDGIFESLSKPGTGSAKEEQMRAAEIRLWSMIASGVLSLGLSQGVFGGDDEALVIQRVLSHWTIVRNGDGESTRTLLVKKDKLIVIN
jgi:hypothetical protein